MHLEDIIITYDCELSTAETSTPGGLESRNSSVLSLEWLITYVHKYSDIISKV